MKNRNKSKIKLWFAPLGSIKFNEDNMVDKVTGNPINWDKVNLDIEDKKPGKKGLHFILYSPTHDSIKKALFAKCSLPEPDISELVSRSLKKFPKHEHKAVEYCEAVIEIRLQQNIEIEEAEAIYNKQPT